MIRIEALTSEMDGAELASIRIYADVENMASLPKMVRLNKWGHAYIEFRANGSNKGTNETGAKRMRSLLKSADKNGIGVVFAQPAFVRDALNAKYWGMGMRYITRGQLEQLIG